MAEPIGWRTIVEVSPDDAELVADAMFQAGALGVEERHEHGRVTLIGGMPDEASARAFAAAHAGARVEPILDDRWADEWRKWAAPVRVGDLVVQPAWLHDAPPVDARFVISIDPGRAFGSGSHESTRLALAEVIARTPRGGRLLDVGCGSGVLGIAAAVVHGAHVVAIDIDPHAVDVTRENAARNGVAHLVDARRVALSDLQGSFDVVVANILAVTLRELAAGIAPLVASEGIVVLSGMLCEQATSVDEAYAALGLRPIAERVEGDWCARTYALAEA